MKITQFQLRKIFKVVNSLIDLLKKSLIFNPERKHLKIGLLEYKISNQIKVIIDYCKNWSLN